MKSDHSSFKSKQTKLFKKVKSKATKIKGFIVKTKLKKSNEKMTFHVKPMKNVVFASPNENTIDL